MPHAGNKHPLYLRPQFVGHDVKSYKLIQASRLPLFHDVDEWQPNPPVQHHDASDRHLPTAINNAECDTRYNL